MKTSTILRSLHGGLLAASLLSQQAAHAQVPAISSQLIVGSTPTAAQQIARFNPNFGPSARASRPTLVVLIHGGTSAPQNSPSPFEPESPAGEPSTRPGNLGYSRFYWDFPFVKHPFQPNSGRKKILKLSAEGKRRHFLELLFEKLEVIEPPYRFSNA